MSYVDAILDKSQDLIFVVEREHNQRIFNQYPANYVFYYEDPKGKYRSIFNTALSKFASHSYKDFQKELRIQSHKKIFESDINPVIRCLADNYRHKNPPHLHVAFFDIETDFDSERGFSSPDEPFAAVNSISVYLSWLDKLVTLALPPKTLTFEQAEVIAGKFEDTYVFHSEKELLDTFLNLIDDADVLSGWNSEGFDIPYLVNRVSQVLSKHDIKRFCLWGQTPKRRSFEKFGAEQSTYDLVGRLHVDYMGLYRKFTYEERQSYSLNAIAEFELNEHKTHYEGTLDQLYNNDFHKFIEYNRQDVLLLKKIDSKLQFLDLANNIIHESTVLMSAALGTVAIVEQAVVNEAHDLGMIVPNKQRHDDTIVINGEIVDLTAAGAYVATPKRGLHEWVGATDINSLYPNTIRSLNMGLETIVGQVRPTHTDEFIRSKMEAGSSFARAWEGQFGSLEYQYIMEQRRDIQVIIDWEHTGTSDELSAAEAYQLIFNSNQPWMISANGTIFTWEREGIVPGIFKRWYAERKTLQKKKKISQDIASGIELPEDLRSLIAKALGE